MSSGAFGCHDSCWSWVGVGCLTEMYLQLRVGSGAYGSVVKALDQESGKLVAIKRIANVFISKTDALRILREVCHAAPIDMLPSSHSLFMTAAHSAPPSGACSHRREALCSKLVNITAVHSSSRNAMHAMLHHSSLNSPCTLVNPDLDSATHQSQEHHIPCRRAPAGPTAVTGQTPSSSSLIVCHIDSTKDANAC